MGKKQAKQPTPPDPGYIINLQSGENRNNTYSPYGSTEWVTGPDGRPSQETTLNPALQQVSDSAFGNALTPLQRQQMPAAFENLGAALAAKIGNHYGLSGSSLTGAPKKPQFAGQPLPNAVQSTYPPTGLRPLPYTPPPTTNTAAKPKG